VLQFRHCKRQKARNEMTVGKLLPLNQDNDTNPSPMAAGGRDTSQVATY